MAGGVLMAALLAHVVGIKVAVPVMTTALIFSHTSRAVIYWRDTDWSIAGRVLVFGLPTIVLGAVVFGRLDPRTIAIIFALFLISSFPIKYWARRHNIKTGPRLLAGASAVWGMLAGNVIGPGFFLAPFLLGTGIKRLTAQVRPHAAHTAPNHMPRHLPSAGLVEVPEIDHVAPHDPAYIAQNASNASSPKLSWPANPGGM